MAVPQGQAGQDANLAHVNQNASHLAAWQQALTAAQGPQLIHPEGGELATAPSTSLPVPFLMNDISKLMAAITMAKSQGPGTAAHALAQTMEPLAHMAIALQLRILNSASAAAGGGVEESGDGTREERQQRGGRDRGQSSRGRKRSNSSNPSIQLHKNEGNGASASEKSRRRRTSNTKYAEYVDIDIE